MVILGIDPGLAIVGWGVLECVKGKFRVLGYGSINAPIFAKGPFRNQEDILKGDAKKSVAFRSEMVKRGYMFIPAEPKRLVVSYSHTEADIDETLNVAEDVLKAMKEAGTV